MIDDKNVFWVEDEYRKNPLSLEEGKFQVIVYFRHVKKSPLGYRNIHDVDKYIEKFKDDETIETIVIKKV